MSQEATAAGVALKSPAGKLLFLKRSRAGDHPGEWCFPGGKVEAGEDAAAAARRELREETGHEHGDEFGDPLDVYGGFATFAGAAPNEFKPKLDGEHTDYRWAMPNEPPQPLHPGVAETLASAPAYDRRPRRDTAAQAGRGRVRAADRALGAARRLVRDAKGYYAPEKLGRTRSMTPEGFLLCEGVPIARTGSQLYNAQELDVEPNGAGYVVVDRPVGEVFHPDTLASFEGKPVTVEHPPDGVVPENYKEHAVGHVQNVRRGKDVEDDLILADFLITDPHAIKYVNEKLPEVSAGYNADYEQTEAGKATQRHIIGNHVALVKAGRAGSRVAVRDSINSAATGRRSSAHMPKASISRIVRLLVQHGVPVNDAEAEAREVVDAAEDPDTRLDRDIVKRIDSIAERIDAMESRDKARDAERKAQDSFEGLVKKLEGEGKSKEYATKVAGKVAKEKGADASPEEFDRRVKDAEAAVAREEADAARARDAEAQRVREEDARRAKDAGEREAEEAEATGDTVLEAESVGKVVNLGKLYTGDSGQRVDVLADVASKAEILSPGIKVPTADSLKGNKGTALAQFMRQALEAHAGTKDGADNVKAFALGAKVSELKGAALVGAFNGAAQLARAQNNRRGTVASRRHVGDGSRAIGVQSINDRNKKFWADRKAAEQGRAGR